MVRQDKVKPALSGADDDGAWRFPSIKPDRLALDRRGNWLQLQIQGIGEYRRRSGAQKEAGQDGGADQIAAHDFPRRDNRQSQRTHDDSARSGSTWPLDWPRGVIMAQDRPDAMLQVEPELANS